MGEEGLVTMETQPLGAPIPELQELRGAGWTGQLPGAWRVRGQKP